MQVLYIQHMAIAPEFRRRGVGTLLLSSAMESARIKGINRVELDVWTFNAEARRFYTKHGFEVFNERMQLSINEA
jgi:ribosomal protein S18 acetylase RimI-like enzyme